MHISAVTRGRLIDLKRYCAWTVEAGMLPRDPAKIVKPVGQQASAPRHLSDRAGVSPHDLRHRFGYRMAEVVPLHRLAQIMGHDSLDTTMTYVQATKTDLQQEVEKIAWT